MSILSGMTGLKAAADLTRMLRDGLKTGQVRGDDIAGRIGEIYDYIVDSKDDLERGQRGKTGPGMRIGEQSEHQSVPEGARTTRGRVWETSLAALHVS